MTILSCSGGMEVWAIAIPGSHIAIAAQFLEGVLALLVLGAAGTFARPGVAQFLDDLTHGLRLGLDRESARVAAQAAKTLAFLVGEIERDDRHVLALDVFPNVQLRPVQQGMDPDVRPLVEIRLELIPQLGDRK